MPKALTAYACCSSLLGAAVCGRRALDDTLCPPSQALTEERYYQFREEELLNLHDDDAGRGCGLQQLRGSLTCTASMWTDVWALRSFS
jgi:hypothetical protein